MQTPRTRFRVQSVRGQNLIALGLVFFFVAHGALSVQKVSITADELYHLRYGANILSLRSKRIDDSKMPITALNAIPSKLAAHVPEGGLRAYLSSLFAARMATIMFSACVAYLVYHWSRLLGGFSGGIASLLLYIMDPNLIAHSQLVTTDVYAAGFVLAVSFWTWKFAVQRNLFNGLMCAAVLGLSQLAKYSTIVLLPLMCVALVLHDAPTLLSNIRSTGFIAVGRYAGKLALYLAAAISATLLLVNAGFLFYRPFMALRDYPFASAVFQSVQGTEVLQDLPIPVPYPYLKGLDLVSYREQNGWSIYLLGQLRMGRGFPGYFLVASALKTPIATQVVLIVALAAYLANPRRKSNFLMADIFLLVPAMFYAIYFNFFYNSQLGIRYYLIIFPLLYVLAGGLFSKWTDFRARDKTAVYVLLAYLVTSVLSYYPFYLAYFNEIVLDRTNAYKYLADSNLSWGQEAYYVRDFLAVHPAAKHATSRPASGQLIVSASELVGVISPPQAFAWLRDNFEPVGTIAYGVLIYDIRPSDLDRLCQTRSICP